MASAESQIRDADVAAQATATTEAQILQSSAMEAIKLGADEQIRDDFAASAALSADYYALGWARAPAPALAPQREPTPAASASDPAPGGPASAKAATRRPSGSSRRSAAHATARAIATKQDAGSWAPAPRGATCLRSCLGRLSSRQSAPGPA